MTIESGNTASADEVMNAMGSLFNDTAQNIFNADYIGFDSRLFGSGAPDLNKVYYSIFTTDDAISTSYFIYNPTNDLYNSIGTHIVIEANDASISWTNNDTILTKVSSGVWMLSSSSTSDSDEVVRAKIHKSLWYGTDGTDQLILDFTNVTAVKTNVTRDVGKQAHFARLTRLSAGGGPGSPATYTGTFVNTTTNDDCSSWSSLTTPNSSPIDCRWEIPDGTIVHQNTTPNTTSDELGTDTTSDELDNPADCQIYVSAFSAGSDSNNDSIMLCVGDITWITSGAQSIFSNIDFLTTHSIPLLTAADAITSIAIFGTNTDIGENITNIVPVVNYSFTSGTPTLEFSNDGSTYATCTNKEVFRPSTTGQKLLLRLTSPSGLPEGFLSEFAIKYNLY